MDTIRTHLARTRPFVWVAMTIAAIALPSFTYGAELKLLWTDTSANEDGFIVERMTSDGTFAQIATIGPNVQSYTDSGLTAGVTYCYRVRAFNSAGVSDPSNGACGTPADSSPTAETGSSTDLSNDGSSTITLTTGSNPSAPSVSYIGSKWSDYKLAASITSTNSGATGAMFRYLDNNNYYRFSWNRTAKTLRLEKRMGGAFTVVAEQKQPKSGSKSFSLQIAAQGSSLKVWVNGKLTFSVTDDSISEGTFALFSSDTRATFDNLVVTDLATGEVLVSDNFNDGDFRGWTTIDDHGTSGSSSWSVSNGSLTQNGAIGSGTSEMLGTYALYTRSPWSDYRLTATLASNDTGTIGLLFRYQDARNHYRFSWDNERRSRSLVKVTDGLSTTLAEDAAAYVTGQSYHVEIVAAGSSLSVGIDGAPLFSVTDSTFSGGAVGLYSSRSQQSMFDEVLVQDVPSGAILLWDNFDHGDFKGWTVVDYDSGQASAWFVQDGALVQSSDAGSATVALYTP